MFSRNYYFLADLSWVLFLEFLHTSKFYFQIVDSYCFVVGWGSNQVAGFGEEPGIKQQFLNLIRSVRTVMRSKYYPLVCIYVGMISYQGLIYLKPLSQIG